MQIEAITSSLLDEYPRFRAYKSLVALMSCFIMFASSTLFITRVLISNSMHNSQFCCSIRFNMKNACSVQGGMYILQLFDWYAASISVILICLCEIVIVGWIYGVANFVRDIEFMIGSTVEKWWIICWKYITPSILSVCLVTFLSSFGH